MKALRTQLLLATLGVLLLAWLLWMAIGVLQTLKLQSGWSDESLRDLGNVLLASLPADIDVTSPGASLSLPMGVEAPRMKKGIIFQVWVLPDRLVMRSSETPFAPLKSDFADGAHTQRIEGEQWRVYAVTDRSGRVQVQVGKAQAQLLATLRLFAGATLVTAVMIFVSLALVLRLVLAWSLRRVTGLQQLVSERREFDLDPLPSAGLPCELRPLIDSFNRLLTRVEQAIRDERQFIADAAHELRTPLAAVQAHAQVALRADDDAQRRNALSKLIGAVQRGTRLAQQLLDSARLEAGQHASHSILDLSELVSVVTREFDHLAQQNRQSITLNTEPCFVLGDTDELGILIRNLVDNALRYSGAGGHIAVSCEPVRNDGTVNIRLRVLDDGPGVPVPDRARIFERFFRSSSGNGRRGSGIGLSLVRRIAESHTARIAIGEGLGGGGLGISVLFPAAERGNGFA